MIAAQWSKKKLGELCHIQTGGTPSRSNPEYFMGTVPWITTVAIGSMYVDETKAVEFISEIAITESSTKIIPANSILIGIRVGVGKSSITLCDIAINQDIAALTNISEHCDLRYLVRVLRTYQSHFDSVKRGATIQGITTSVLKQLEIPLPPLETQKKIAAVLDKAQELIDKRKEQLAKLDEFVQSVFSEMFGDLSCNPKKWEFRKFDYFAKIDTVMTKDFESYKDYPHIGIDNIEKNTGKLTGYKTVKEDRIISGKYIFNSSHIIYSKIRPNLNKVAIPSFEGLCSADAYPLLINHEHTNRHFFAYVLRSEYFLNYILKQSSRTNIPKVNKEQLRTFCSICPPLDLQNQFAAIVEKTEQQKALMQQSLTEMENNFNSLMQQAFKGELFR